MKEIIIGILEKAQWTSTRIDVIIYSCYYVQIGKPH